MSDSDSEASALSNYALALMFAGTGCKREKAQLFAFCMQQFSESLNAGTENESKSILSFLSVLHSFNTHLLRLWCTQKAMPGARETKMAKSWFLSN